MHEKEAWSVERAWDRGACQCLAGDTRQALPLSEPWAPRLQDKSEATYLSDGDCQIRFFIYNS